ncbi:prostaglandin E2 receptor EP2 subtype [Ornithorhynchus anatinus]|uniref:prostaglandin E2 receptor EP2 subtype n=1 Tax=Ornithorhynchus anatinus TaxID=9258 RepID=UPI0010A92D9C|nr:prostaglandin E2 receptor EP2 subtype [Ornithorhynchus anatinus]
MGGEGTASPLSTMSGGSESSSRSSSSPKNCSELQWLSDDESPAISAAMFAAGVLGNLVALALLSQRWWRGARVGRSSPADRRQPITLFHVLVTGLVVTDLLGTCSISPVVLTSYASNRTLEALAPSRRLCKYFAFAMTFFSLATMLLLFSMALERCLALGHPYFYQRRVTRSRGLLALPAAYGLSLLFGSLLLFDQARYEQYCPGTWCFLAPQDSRILRLYATLLLLLIVSILACNLSFGLSLVRMHRRRHRGLRAGRGRRSSVTQEADHLILLAIMTITFAVCSLPITIYAYMNKTYIKEENWDLRVLRFLSMNSIINPWVFAILRPPVLHLVRSVLCCQISFRTQEDPRNSLPAQSKTAE